MKYNDDKILRKNLHLREKYDTGEISADEFLKKLFSSREADRNRQKITKKKNRFFQRT